MNRSKVKSLTFIMYIILVIAIISGCSSNANTNNNTSNKNTPDTKEEAAPAPVEEKKTGLDTSEKVELQFYMLGDAPKDLSIIQDKINEMALADLNATVKFNYTTWTDWDQKYKLLLSSGQPIDLIFTADWTQYQSYAKKGAFLAIDDLLPTAAPVLNSFVPKDMWEAVKIDGKIYTVPATYKEYVTGGFVYREDLREKYNLPKPESLETFEAYMDGIKKNEPRIIPMGTSASNHVDGFKDIKYKLAGLPLPYGMSIPYENPSDITSYWGSAEHIADLKTYKRWMDKGFWSKNVLNMKDTSKDLLVSGKTATIITDNPTRFNDEVIQTQAAHPDWKLAYYPFPLTKGYATPVHPIHNGFAVPKSSKNPERALAFYEKMVTDKRYNQLTQYGIEGTNYKIEGGYYELIGDANSNGFPREAMNGWAWRNPEFMLFNKTYDGVKAIFEELDKVAKPDIFTGFAEDWTPYQAEKAALEQVEKQYLYPLNVGLVDDVEAGLKNFMEKAKQAGLDKIQDEYKKQWLQYVSDAGLK